MESNLEVLSTLSPYIVRGWPVFPVARASKAPIPEHGFYDATTDDLVIAEWIQSHPACGWGIPTGEKTALVIDVDDPASWIDFVGGREVSATYEIRTPRGGRHLYFVPPDGFDIRNSQGLLADGVDVRANGGYVVVPPTDGYEVVNDGELAPLPSWIQKELLVDKAAASVPDRTPGTPVPAGARHAFFLRRSVKLARLGQDADEIVAMLRGYSDDSRLMEAGDHPVTRDELQKIATSAVGKYGVDAPLSFSDDELQKVLGQDTELVSDWGEKFSPSIDNYVRALDEGGFGLQRSSLDDGILLGERPLSDKQYHVIRLLLHDRGYRHETLLKSAIENAASRRTYNPILAWWDSEPWDGVAHIHNLAGYFKDRHDMFDVWLRRFCIGSVAKVLAETGGVQNRMLVLESKQGLGKSHFSRWLAGPLTDFYREGAIRADDKDARIRLASMWLNEVGELGGTFRKEDRDALKFFLSMSNIVERRPYGHFDVRLISRTSFIGTLNSEGGFLTDPTGNRRYFISSFTEIDWAYSKQIDVQQVWAEALAAYRGGEGWELRQDEAKIAEGINEGYEVYDPLVEDLTHIFIVEPGNMDMWTSSEDIRLAIESGLQGRGLGRVTPHRIGKALARLGCEGQRQRVSGKQERGYSGIKRRN